MSLKIYGLVVAGGIGDYITTGIGLSLGFTETRAYAMPLLTPFVICPIIWLSYRSIYSSFSSITKLVRYGLTLLCLSPVLGNLFVIIGGCK